MTVYIYYFPIRGRAEVIKLLCAAKGVQFEMRDVDYEQMKTDRTQYPFGQCPRLVDGDVDICQSNATIRHLARKHGLYGSHETEMALVDMYIDGVESIRCEYVGLIYRDQLADDSKSAYWQMHGAKEGATGRNKGAHFDYLEQLLARNKGGNGFAAGSSLTAADICVWEIVDLHMRIYKEQMTATYPLLTAHYQYIAELPGIKEYLASPARLEKVNNNNLG